jgi:NADH-quinone oxidoreductase subunit M
VVYDRVHDRTISNFSGLWQLMPHYGFFTLVGFFASLGLPGFAAFVSELMVFMGALQSASVSEALPRWMPMVAVLGIVLGAVYYLRTYRQMFFGTFDPAETSDWRPHLKDLTLREYLLLAPLALLILLLGLLPSLAIDLFADTVALLTAHVLGE